MNHTEILNLIWIRTIYILFDNTNLDEMKEKTEWRKCVFESKLENKYDFESQNGMTFMNVKK